ncbi:MAG: DUF308 domain-containing protein [Chloroflexi bacterium]|nr:DUF308 domain-containing protein [Chloroflexota bacterium]
MATAEASIATPISSNRWWILLLEGIAGIIIGILLFTDTEQTVFTLVLFLGIWWFIGGIIDLITLFFNREQWGWRLFTGILGIIAGLILIRHPIWSALLVPATLAWLLGIFGIVIGIMGLIRAFQGEGWGTGILGVISVVFGLWLLGAGLGMQIAVIIYGAAIWAIIGGIVAIIWAFRVRAA